MKTFPDVRMRRLHELASRGVRAGQAEAHADALALFRELKGELGRLGLKSAWTHWAMAVAHDNQGEHEMALNEIRKALAQDPLSPTTRRSFDIIVGRLRQHLHGLPVTDESILRLYGLLQQSGDVDVPTHLLVARHFAATGRPERAEELLESLSLLAPAAREVWLERARIARGKGDLAGAASFEAEAHARCLPDVPFAIPTTHVE